MATKSEYLIHWTGKDINAAIDKLTDIERSKYIERLRNTCQSGLWMMPNVENLRGRGNVGFGSYSQITCFTENRVDYYLHHARKYGLMGFGFNRQWVLDRDGMPVIYLKNDSTDLQTQIISNIIFALEKYKDDQGNLNKKFSSEYSLLLDYAKPMSNVNTNDFTYLEEAEWRICWNSAISSSKIELNKGNKPPDYFLPFKPDELKLIILPDINCRKMAMSDPQFLSFYQSGNCGALILSLQEIEKL
jgi:hypothetical protein